MNKTFISISLMCDMSRTRGNSYCDWADPDKALERTQIFQLFICKKKKSPEIEVDFSSSCKICSLNSVEITELKKKEK